MGCGAWQNPKGAAVPLAFSEFQHTSHCFFEGSTALLHTSVLPFTKDTVPSDSAGNLEKHGGDKTLYRLNTSHDTTLF